MEIIPLIIAGGSGSRLWPLSQPAKPKQFQAFSGPKTLLEETIDRLKSLKPPEYVIVTADKYEKLSKQELKKARVKGTILLEPAPKNTAAAILYGALYLKKKYKDAYMIVLPADHYIKNKAKFISTLKKTLIEAKKNKIVTIGIPPTTPETGYGYIKFNSKNNLVDKFVEKPNLTKAKQYLKSKNYLWNSGIFIWKVSTILEAFAIFLPEQLKVFQPLAKKSAKEIRSSQSQIWALKKKIFASLKSISVDYGILEKAKGQVVIPAEFDWNDLGSWQAIDQLLDSDKKNTKDKNRSTHKNTLFIKSKNCSVLSLKKKVALIGVEDLVVVEEGENLLILNKKYSQEVKKVTEGIK